MIDAFINGKIKTKTIKRNSFEQDGLIPVWFDFLLWLSDGDVMGDGWMIEVGGN